MIELLLAGVLTATEPTCFLSYGPDAVQIPCPTRELLAKKGELYWFTDQEQGVVVEFKDTACRRKMEAAMRAMEPFIEWAMQDHGKRADVHNPIGIPPLAERYKQWQAVKRECWRTP